MGLLQLLLLAVFGLALFFLVKVSGRLFRRVTPVSTKSSDLTPVVAAPLAGAPGVDSVPVAARSGPSAAGASAVGPAAASAPAHVPVAALPAEVAASLETAKLLYRSEKWDETTTLLRDILARSPGCAEAWFYLGLIAYSAAPRRELEARSHFESTIAIDPLHKNAHFYLGEVLSRSGARQAAIENYRAVLAIEPAHARARASLVSLGVDPDHKTEPPPPARDVPPAPTPTPTPAKALGTDAAAVAAAGGLYNYIRLRAETDEKYELAHRMIDQCEVPPRRPIPMAYLQKILAAFATVAVLFLVLMIFSGTAQDYERRIGSDVALAGPHGMIRQESPSLASDQALRDDFNRAAGYTAIATIIYTIFAAYAIRRRLATLMSVHQGAISIAGGVMTNIAQKHMVYSVKDFEVVQNFWNMRTNDGALRLIVDGKKPVDLIGLGKYPELLNLRDKLIELRVVYRSLDLDKGVMN